MNSLSFVDLLDAMTLTMTTMVMTTTKTELTAFVRVSEAENLLESQVQTLDENNIYPSGRVGEQG